MVRFFSQPIKKKRIKTLIGIGLLIIAIFGGGFIYLAKSSNLQKAKQKIKETFQKKEEGIPSPLDGKNFPKNLVELFPLAVVIENHPDARPQSGLSQANIVYEVIAEGGITRFLALFNGPELEEIGPIRSARTYFIEWAKEYKGILVHAGGATNALQQLATGKIPHLNHTQGYFVRKRKAGVAIEHTLYSDTSNLYKLAEKKGYLKEKFSLDGFQFKSEKKEDLPENLNFTIDFSYPNFKVTWNYQKESNSFIRSQAGKPHIDKLTQKPIEAKNIVIQRVSKRSVGSGGKTVFEYFLTGEGEAFVLVDGKKIEAEWKKATTSSKTRFFNKLGEEIKFNPGPIWIEIIPPEVKVSFD